ncbi:hypothetical protein OF376_02765 [Ureaplasma miroungigenitalium]|uniref:Lipoprotein n=1 Tax=Ureaplasma miroungigenitalium TaxID=1042321 RepID=A0ABT3BN75_9BACT|nr:hypothetical protein [Ureaplasma miroungigenitalium]MCV3728685.1 hypothetical protein [Ureaplasma miroungigenitalium]
MTKKKIWLISTTAIACATGLVALTASCKNPQTQSPNNSTNQNSEAIKTLKLDEKSIVDDFIKKINVKRPMSDIKTQLTYNINKIKNEQTSKDPNFTIDNKSVFEINQSDISTTDFTAMIKRVGLENAMTFYTDGKVLNLPKEVDVKKPSFVPFNSFICDYYFDSSYEDSGFLDYDQQNGQIRYFSLVEDPTHTTAVYQAIPSFLKGFKKTSDRLFIFEKAQFNWIDEQKDTATYHVVVRNQTNNQLYETDAIFNHSKENDQIVYTRLDLKTTDEGNYVLEKIYDASKPNDNLLLPKNIGFSIYGPKTPIKATASMTFNAFVIAVRNPLTGEVELKRNYTFGKVLVDQKVAQTKDKENKKTPFYFDKPLNEIDLYDLDHIFFPVLYTSEPLEDYDMQYVAEKDANVPEQFNFKVRYTNRKTKVVVESANAISIRYVQAYNPSLLTSVSVECDLKVDSQESKDFINKYKTQDLSKLTPDELLNVVNQAFSIYYYDVDLEKYSVKTVAKLLANNQVELSFYTSFKQTKENMQTANEPNILIGTQKINLFEHAK